MTATTIALIAELILALCRLDSGSYAPQLGAVPEMRALYLAQALHDAATVHHVDPLLLTALVYRESSFDSAAVSPIGAFGLGQLLTRYWGREALRLCLIDPSSCDRWNLFHSARAVAHYRKRCGSDGFAITAYRTGRCGPTGPQARKVIALRNAMRRVTTNDPMPLAFRAAVSL